MIPRGVVDLRWGVPLREDLPGAYHDLLLGVPCCQILAKYLLYFFEDFVRTYPYAHVFSRGLLDLGDLGMM